MKGTQMLREIQSPDNGASLLYRLASAFSLKRNLKDLFLRPPEQIAVFDGVRGFFMLVVFAIHAVAIFCRAHPAVGFNHVYEFLGESWRWLLNAEYSVDVFFTLSGFLITSILLRQISRQGKIQIRQFYMRRYLRLTPVYYVALIIYGMAEGPNSGNLWANVFYVNNFLHYENQAMDWSWSLAVEEQFYLLFPVILGLLMKTSRPVQWMWGLFACSFLIRFCIIVADPILRATPVSHALTDAVYSAHRASVIYDDFHNRYGAILIGCIAAYYYYFFEEQVRRFFSGWQGQLLGLCGTGLIFGFFVFPIFDSRYDDNVIFQVVFETIKHNCVGIGSALIVLASIPNTAFSRVLHLLLGGRIWYPLGQLAYSTYIIHLMVISVVVPTGINISLNNHGAMPDSLLIQCFILMGLAYAVTTFISFLIYLIIERPIMNMRS